MVTRPAPPRRAASAARRAAPVIVAPPTTVTWPREYLCDCDPGTGRRHSSGRLAKHVGRTCCSTAVGQADIGEHGLAAQFATRQQKMPRLQPEERHRQRCLRRKATHRAGSAIEPARHIHRNHTPRRAQRIGDDAIHVPRQAGTEHGVDHQLRTCRLRRREWCGWTTPVRRGIGGIRAGARRSQRSQRNRPAFLLQQPRRDIAVAAIVARSRPAQACGTGGTAAGSHAPPRGRRSPSASGQTRQAPARLHRRAPSPPASAARIGRRANAANQDRMPRVDSAWPRALTSRGPRGDWHDPGGRGRRGTDRPRLVDRLRARRLRRGTMGSLPPADRGRARLHRRAAARTAKRSACSRRRRQLVASRVRPAATLAEAVAGAEHVQENGPERVDAKQALFGELDQPHRQTRCSRVRPAAFRPAPSPRGWPGARAAWSRTRSIRHI